MTNVVVPAEGLTSLTAAALADKSHAREAGAGCGVVDAYGFGVKAAAIPP